jgi:hypothetical protein
MARGALVIATHNDTLRSDFIAAKSSAVRNLVQRLSHGGMAQRLRTRPDGATLAEPLVFLHVWHWLQEHVPAAYRREVLSFSRNPAFAPVVEALVAADSPASFVARLVVAGFADGVVSAHGDDPEAATRTLLDAWSASGGNGTRRPLALREVAADERHMYDEQLGAADRRRLTLIDGLPESAPVQRQRFAKLGVIPVMRCPQGCHHCLFLYRPRVVQTREPAELLATASELTDSLLYTGGDLTSHLADFAAAIAGTPRINTFAILLNGVFATDRTAAEAFFAAMDDALRERRRNGLGEADVVLQISFDEHHQEIYPRADGALQERIPVAFIANIVEAAVRHPQIGLALLHKQNVFNFSRDLFQRGVFARLARELGRRGHRIEVLEARPGPRPRANPCTATGPAQVITDAHFILTGHPDIPVRLTSTTVDAYGQAALLDASEFLNDRAHLEAYLEGGEAGEGFDSDLMFWYDGRVTCFSAVHYAVGDLYAEGIDTILSRQRKDPLLAALRRFDRRLLDLYAEVRDDLPTRLAGATSVHHLFHQLTFDADVRLHLTERLIAGH